MVLVLLSVGVLFPQSTLHGADEPQDPPREPQEITPDDAGENPDLPGFLDGKMDMEEYHRLRAGALSEYRGLPYDPDLRGTTNPRAAAIRSLQATQASRFQPATGGLPPASWEPVGPEPIPNGQTTTRADPVSGRVTAIAVDPLDADIAYVGTAQGGVYRTLDGGSNWTAIFDAAQSLAIGALAVAPSNRDVLYVGTGEAGLSGDAFFGVGLYRIDNARTTADLVGPIDPPVATGIAGTTAFTGRAISRILVHPTDPATIFVSTSTGIGGVGGATLAAANAVPPLGLLGLYRSTNATSASPSFQKVRITSLGSLSPDTSGNSRVTDMIFAPGNPNLLVVGVHGGPPQGGFFGEGGIWRSQNALAATPGFTQELSLSNGIRVEFAVNKVGPTTTLLAATAESSVFTGSSCSSSSQSGALRRSTDLGDNWSARLPGGAGFCGGQCFYNIGVALDPGDANLVYLGGANNSGCSRVYVRSTDGGATFALSDVGLHADTHAIAVAPSDPSVVYIGNDGGTWRSNDSARTWTSLNNAGFNATQFQSLALHPVDREFLIGGTQDNGTQLRRPDGSWTRSDAGDGGFALIDQGATDTENVTMYHTYFNQSSAMGYGRVTLTSEAEAESWPFFGCGFVPGTNGLNCGASTPVLFYAPMALGPGTPNTVYFGSDRLFRSTDRGETMVQASQGPLQPFLPGAAVSAIGIAPQDEGVRLVGMRFGKVFGTATGAGILADITGPWPVSANLAAQPRRFVSRVAIDPTDSNVAYVAFATYCGAVSTCGQVYKTTNLVIALLASSLPSWTKSSAGLPDIPVSAFVVDPRNPQSLFAGTDIGVYASSDGGASWAPFGSGLPRVSVFDMALHAPSGTLRVATHGRGIWEIAVGDATPVMSGLASPSIGLGSTPTLLYGYLKAGSLAATGSVEITLGASTLSGSLDPATGFFAASFDTGALGAGSYAIGYSYAGGTGFNPATGSGTLTVGVALAPTTTSLDASATVFPDDAPVTVTVDSAAGTPTGNVTLQVDGGSAVTQPLVAGNAIFALPGLTVGSHSLLAQYMGDPPFGASASVGTLTVTSATPGFTVASPVIALGQTPSLLGGTLVLGGSVPSGSVEITLGGVVKTAALDPATGAFSASFDTGGLLAGAHPVAFAFAGDANFEPASATATLVVTTAVTTTTFSNPVAIVISDAAPGSPYPSVITVAGVPGKVLEAEVTLKGVSHSFPADTSFLLVGPDGNTTLLLHHTGGDLDVVNADLAFDDAGAAAPVSGPLVSGTYRPTRTGEAGDLPPGGAPGPDPPLAPYGEWLFAQNGASPNGAWRLYVADDVLGDAGDVAQGWELRLTTVVEPGLSVDDVTVAEGALATFTLTLSAAPAFPVDVDYATSPGSAASGSDFVPRAGTVRFEALETTKTVAVATVDDPDDEPGEIFTLDLTNPVGAALVDAEGEATILDDDPRASIEDVRRVEGHAGTTAFVFTVRLAAPPLGPVSVRYATVAQTASSSPRGRDFIPASGILAFAAGETTRTITVGVVGDRAEEKEESFKVVLSSPVGLTLERTEAFGFIVNDDFVGPPRMTIADATLLEGDAGAASMVFTVRLNRVASTVVSVRYATAAGTAVAGGDFTATTGTLTFPLSTTERTISVPVIGDLLDEGNETFLVNLSQVRGAGFLDAQARGTIEDDDP